jgi:pyridoxine kinase
VLNGAQLEALAEGLSANGLLAHTTHLLTGYIGSASFLDAVATVHARLVQANASAASASASSAAAAAPGGTAAPLMRNYPLTYVCDPVLGDHGQLYVPASLVAVYKAKLLPLATVLTPNGFEAEQLTGLKVCACVLSSRSENPWGETRSALARTSHPARTPPRASPKGSGRVLQHKYF